MPIGPLRHQFAQRLRALRQAQGISQTDLGVRMGLSPDVASARINRYEQGVHVPDLDTLDAMAKELGVPLPALFAEGAMAELITAFARLPDEAQEKVLATVRRSLKKNQGKD